MGIQGLLPLLKSIQRPTELKKYDGETIGVDAYGWLHRGAVPCAIELAQGKPTRKYVDFAMNRVKMLKHFGITPYLVFDGGFLPSKAATEASRAKRREECRKTGLELLKAGKPSQAHAELQKAVDVTPEMARHLIEELKKADVPYVVAPYEADPQLVYLEREGHISGILSEDSDLLVFGAKRLLTKLDQHGQCIEINRRDFCACREVSLTGWTDAQFRQMAILSGCDYLDSINSLGLKTAHRMMRKHKTPEKVIRMLQFDGKYRVPADYLKLFHQAEQTFLHQWVFCPKANQLVNFTQLSPDVKVDELPFLGPPIEPETARGIAIGDINPITKQTILLPTLPSPRKRTASGTARNVPQTRTIREPPAKPIDSYFKGHRRIPLGEMEPNCFSVDPARLAGMTENGNRPIVYPLPRPYLDETDPTTSSGPRAYITRPGSSARTLRRRTEPVTNLLGNGGHTLGSGSRRQTTGPGVNVLSNSESGGAVNTVRPPKKARLCDDTNSGRSPGKEKSKFFPRGNVKGATTKKTEGYLMSDDSIEEALKDLPDFGGWGASLKDEKEVLVYQESQSALANTEISKDDESYHENGSSEPSEPTSSVQDNVLPNTPSLAKRFSYHGQSRRESVSTSSSSRSSLSGLTPATSVMSSTSFSSVQLSTGKTTPATPLQTPLQRLGIKALGRGNQPSTPTFVAPRPKKRSSLVRQSIDSMPINPAFVPLPPVDLEEVEALHRPIGSEDLIIPESENEEALDEQENLGSDKGRAAGNRRIDLSRFLFA
ncbi:uncharacterized protein F4812DRAFT_426392 [Daldinia caldariorum]|uniref:uncharacterized protein n=1 Tax=Daldinia caldariorum TaxID=326644 RepID=UPI0020077B15|nr:uncharacterized protein F4812DRAFT_426392 [Daldinia caldariorum]KAI1468349.1 hypothetical protein F4812DRAFT_426392 [Daldinia caldariorum]